MSDSLNGLVDRINDLRNQYDSGMANDLIDCIVKMVERHWQAYLPAKQSEIPYNNERLVKIAQFIHDRMIHVHGENENVDYLHGMRDVIKYLATPVTVSGRDACLSPTEDKKSCPSEIAKNEGQTEQPVEFSRDEFGDKMATLINTSAPYPGNYETTVQQLTRYIDCAYTIHTSKFPKREISSCEEQGNCPLCKREITGKYYKSWRLSMDCKGCGFRDDVGILGEPPLTKPTSIEGQT